MACQAMHMWTLSGLVAAFLDLAIAYFLLCASTVAFFASKFLGFFGLNLPCPCDGLFLGIPSKEYCLNRLLVDFPTSNVSEIQVSVKRKFPFNDSVWRISQSGRIGENNSVNGFLELEGEASCSSVSDRRISRNVVRRGVGGREVKYDVKGKAVVDHRPRSCLRQRRRGGGGGRGHYSSVSSYEPSLHEEVLDGEPHMDFGTDKGGSRLSSPMVDDGFDSHHPEYDKNFMLKRMSRGSVNRIQINHYPDDGICMETNITSIEHLQDNEQGVQCLSGDEKDAVELLENALEEERATRASLYIELEKERSAAASAADEAMAMILRLQEEKASIEMEARQYQRILEEKSAYDAEEMNILKEILVRRETEKHFLEKEVEAYRQMIALGNEQTDDLQLLGLAVVPDYDPVLMLEQLTASTDKKIMVENGHADGIVSYDKPIDDVVSGNESSLQKQDTDECSKQISIDNDAGNIDLQEKEIVYADTDLNAIPKAAKKKFFENTILLERNKLQQEELNLGTEHGPSLKQRTKDARTESIDPRNLTSDQDYHVYDVHVVGDQFGLTEEANVSKQLSVSGPSTSGLPPLGPKGKMSLSDLRRSSLSSLDSEMLKIDCEVGRLRERLKTVQEERDKLSLSKESREKENVQLKLLEDIARQIQEIRHFTEPGKAARQVSLPLPDSKVFSKKRRCRSVSSGLQRNSDG